MAILSRESVTKLYVATFNRAPDKAGLDYWVNESGLEIELIAQSFFDQPETKALYPSGTTSGEFVNAVYNNLFNRDAETNGLAYWINELESGRVSKQNFILAVVNGALGDDAVILENKTSVGSEFANAGLNDTSQAAAIMQTINADPSTVSAALLTISVLSEGNNSEEDTAINPIIDPFEYSNTNYELATLASLTSPGAAELGSGTYWDSSRTMLTYSFNESIPDSYYFDNALTTGFTQLNDEQKTIVRYIMKQIDDVLGINLTESPTDGDIRFSLVDQGSGSAAFAFYPGEIPDYLGDVFLNTEFNNPSTTGDFTMTSGGYGWNTIVHELGHALGLEHPFGDYTQDPSQNGEPPHLAPTYDNNLYSIMSYTETYHYVPEFTVTGNYINGSWKGTYNTLYALYDLNALQSIYGANTTSNTGNDVYTFAFDDFTYQTIWDAGGIDTFDLSTNTGNTMLNLNGGTLNSIDEYSLEEIVGYFQNTVGSPGHNDWIANTISDLYAENTLYTGKNNIAIGTGVVIENAYTGSGNDIIIDNAVDNIIHTGAGNDTIYIGNGGYDQVDGGDGIDTLVASIAYAEGLFGYFEGSHLFYTDSYAVKFDNIEYFQFADGTYAVDDIFIA